MGEKDKLLYVLEAALQQKSGTHSAYSDEPILRPASRLPNYVPTEIRELQAQKKTFNPFRDTKESVFFRQAKQMAQYTDDFPYQGEFFCYSPTYLDMNVRELRGYFTWRTKFRRGETEKTSLSFLFVHAYELLQLIGVASPEEGYAELVRLDKAYGVSEPVLHRFLTIWRMDFVVYYGLDAALAEDCPDILFDKAMRNLLAMPEDENELFGAVCALSSYRAEKSAFCKAYPEDYRNVVCGVFRAQSVYSEKHRKKTYCEKLFGYAVEYYYSIFRGAVFFDTRKYRSYQYMFSSIHSYSCKKGTWYCKKYYGSRAPSKELGKLLKTIDAQMRQHYEFSRPLKADGATKLVQGMIDKEIQLQLARRKEREKRIVRLDLSQLGEIRQAAEVTRDLLIVEEEPDFADFALGKESVPEIPEIAAQPQVVAEQELSPCGLDETEIALLQCLLSGEEYSALLRKKHLLLSVAADAINDKLFEIFGDTPIVFEGDAPMIPEEYTEELKGMVGL